MVLRPTGIHWRRNPAQTYCIGGGTARIISETTHICTLTCFPKLVCHMDSRCRSVRRCGTPIPALFVASACNSSGVLELPALFSTTANNMPARREQQYAREKGVGEAADRKRAISLMARLGAPGIDCTPTLVKRQARSQAMRGNNSSATHEL